MSELTCTECEMDFVPGDDEDLRFGGTVQCPHCGAWLNLDWDYTSVSDEDVSIATWVTGPAEDHE